MAYRVEFFHEDRRLSAEAWSENLASAERFARAQISARQAGCARVYDRVGVAVWFGVA